jgi:ATP-binding cassette subfamily F protein 3
VERTKLLKENKEIGEQLEIPGLSEEEVSALTSKMVKIGERLQLIGQDEAERNAKAILFGLGFSNADMDKQVNHFSGGWRMRISLAKALFVQPDILLLDEPTNHLDMNAVMWLEDYLVSWPYTVVIVSHARDFINNVATDIMFIQNLKISYHKGNYDDFEKSRAERLRHVKKQKEGQDRKVAHIESFINRFRANAKRASLVQSRIKALNKIDIVDQISEDPSVIFVFPNPEPLNPPLLKLENVNLGYKKGVNILKNTDFNLDMASRVAIVGPNGAGKTTLLKAVTGELEVLSGKAFRHSKLKLAMFTQHHMDQLNPEYTPIEQIASMYSDVSTDRIRSHLASFGISGNLMLRPNYLLSGGQKTRVAFAALVYSTPQIILMDEPTNHLDIDAVNALALALNNYSGGICIVSHDQHFVESVCDKIYVVQNERVTHFKGNFGDYKKYLKKK